MIKQFCIVTIAAVCLLAWPQTGYGQDLPSGATVGATFQVYPAGYIPAFHAQAPITVRDMLLVYLGINFTNRRDWGEHDSEEGSGAGAGLAWRHYFGARRSGLFAGIRSDLWFMAIEWSDENTLTTGLSDVIVLQPTGQVGYEVSLGESWILGGSLALGRELNLHTDGSEVGQDFIFLGGLRISYRMPPAL
jgi:hypothetical protein